MKDDAFFFSRIYPNRKYHDGMTYRRCNAWDTAHSKKIKVPQKMGAWPKIENRRLCLNEINIINLNDGTFAW